MQINEIITIAACAVGYSLMGGLANAESAGEREFTNSCIACHGATGVGDGPLSEYLTIDVSDLTSLSQENGGEFPFKYVVQIIDGRTGLRGHGDAQPDSAGSMPIWGERFKIEVLEEQMEAESVEDMGRFSSELVVRGRIMALADYLETIQK